MAPTPSSKSNQTLTIIRTPQSKQRLHFSSRAANPSQNPESKDHPPPEHPVEVIGRIRDHPDRKEKHVSILHVNPDRQSIRVRAEIGYRDFTLDGVSLSEEEDLDAFYKKFIETRINGVKVGNKCTIMMYGPTGSGKSHTMFGSGKQPGIVYRSLRDILGDGEGDREGGIPTFVQVTVLEIYNEEIYDLLSSNNGGGFGIGWPKGGGGSKVRLEVMGKKAKNATFLSGTEAGRISKEIQKVEKRRIVKSTLCNDRSSRSHCMIILDVPTVGGRLMLVDMAGSENIEQAGQIGFEAKMQTAKINQGNIALKRVVESIANGDSHVPFRDSKLTMLLQDSFEDDKSKILMVLCASPDPKEIHKTICTLEYGAKAKCIIRGPHTPHKDKNVAEDSSSAVILGSRIAAMDQFIYKLQMENKLREKERNDAHKQLTKKEEEVAALRALLEEKGSGANEEEKINEKVNERTETLKHDLERKLEECRRMAEEFVEMERRRMEERILQQQEEVEMLRRRLEEIELQFQHSKEQNGDLSGFAKRLCSLYGDEDPGMVKSMDLDLGDQEREVKLMNGLGSDKNGIKGSEFLLMKTSNEASDALGTNYGDRVCLSTVFEEEELEEDDDKSESQEDDEEVEKVIVEDKWVCSLTSPQKFGFPPDQPFADSEKENRFNGLEDEKDHASFRKLRIQNIFTLCGNQRELLSHNPRNPIPTTNVAEMTDTQLSQASKENYNLSGDAEEGQLEVYVKWEASKDQPGKFITMLKVVKCATLSDLRKLIEIYLGGDNQAFSFLVLGDPSGAPLPKERELTFMAKKLPLCNGTSHLVCLRPVKSVQSSDHTLVSPLPLSPVENKMPLTPIPGFFSSQCNNALSPHLSSTPFVTRRRH